ncbi:MAG: Sua5/YciO/YrdC/YwlC family protein [Candidatus Doudnabacteria bacterium]|nr:Sua5/YciO/YrdC/YwlC family protein [Candidatus Doudnabacteria bacterium]
MIILNYQKSNHKQIIRSCVHALKQGKAIVYPTDTSYGLAVDATNNEAIKRLYQIKGRNFNILARGINSYSPSLYSPSGGGEGLENFIRRYRFYWNTDAQK